MVGKCYGVSNNLMEDLGRKIENENVISNNDMGVFSRRSNDTNGMLAITFQEFPDRRIGG